MSDTAPSGMTNAPSSPKKLVPTGDDCRKYFRTHIAKEELGQFHKDDAIDGFVPIAETMVKALFKLGCGKEVALQLSLLILYDMVMLIDDSSSMVSEQGGQRIETLKETMEEITTVYQLANKDGIKAVEFINATAGLRGVGKEDWKKCFEDIKYDGVTPIGTSLKRKILDKFVWNAPMTKPLVVIIITDGEAEGEPHWMLEGVISDCVRKITEDSTRGARAVLFQFARVGDDKAAEKLLQKLDDSDVFGKNVDCLGGVDLETISHMDHRWMMVAKLLLGSTIATWDDLVGDTGGGLPQVAHADSDSDGSDDDDGDDKGKA
ncbi:hypothetical protein Q9L58_009693 [Maublancomyces gigas]|uniref:VWFA domain-containing protein n=1 Tax=Discina gigas TaxID=1032678 RepID=A0ABR3G6K3_9PEZI